MDPSGHYPEPFGEAVSHSSQRAAQLISLAAAAAEVAMRLKAARAARQAARTEQQRRRWKNKNAPPAPTPGPGGHPPTMPGGWPRPTCSRPPGPGAPPPRGPAPTPWRHRRCARARNACAPCTRSRWPAMTGSAPKEPSPLDAMREAAPLFARHPHARPGQPATTRPGIEAGRPAPVPGPTLPRLPRERPPARSPPGPLPGRGAPRTADRRAAASPRPGGARSRLSPDELATALEASTSLPAEVIARLARARSEESMATRAERARAADLGRAAAAASARQSTNGLTAARRDTLVADTAGAHASADRTAAQLAAESFPCTTADGIRAAVTGRLQQPAPSPARTAATQNAPRPGLAP